MAVSSEGISIANARQASTRLAAADGLPSTFDAISDVRVMDMGVGLPSTNREPHHATSSRLEVKGMRELDIAEVAQQSGVPASTLRFYEEKGLIASLGRRGLRRVYEPGVMERLSLIALGRTAGFSLAEISLTFAQNGRPRIDRRMLAAKADELDAKIVRLGALRDGLRHAAACPAPSHLECPRFRSLLRAATSGVIEAPRKNAPRRRSL
jgi:DNA-binding transcriptional MerR regulator